MLQGVFPDERDGVLLVDSVEEFGNIRLLNCGAFLIGCLLESSHDGHVTVGLCRVQGSTGLFARRVGAFLGVKFERSAFVNSCDAPIERSEAA